MAERVREFDIATIKALDEVFSAVFDIMTVVRRRFDDPEMMHVEIALREMHHALICLRAMQFEGADHG